MDEQSSEIVAQVATQLIKDSLSEIFTPISNHLTVKRAQFFESFSSYCEYMYGKSSLVRTLYSKNQPMQLEGIYVKTNFTQGENPYTDADLLDKFGLGKRIIVKGNGGSGKTIFLKHLWLTRFKNPEGRIPIFIELRRLNDVKSLDIATFCRSELQADIIFGKGVFEKLCEAGKFEFIFDGFDEVNRDIRLQVERQILFLSEKYRDCCFLVSGREDDRFSSWGQFEIFRVSPLSLSDVKNLIDKVPFDNKVKKKFLETLNDSFYSQHRDFLSSPLLAIMMLMTFNENATIPSKLTTFYNSAFQTLLTWHDATKDSFQRERILTVDQFRKIFSTFCLISYYEQVFEFDEQSLRNFIEKSLRYHDLNIDLDDVKNDICESANLLQKEGLNYLFIHRSFQEFFAAECAMQVVSGKAGEFLSVFAKRSFDSVFSMCYEIHPELVYDKFLGERISSIEESGFLDGLKGNAKKDGLWLYDTAILDCKLSTRRIHIDLGRLKADPEKTELIRFVGICGVISGISYQLDTSTLIFDAVIETLSKTTLPKKFAGVNKDVSLKIEFRISKKAPTISIRNTGTRKIDASQIKALKVKMLPIFRKSLIAKHDELVAYYSKSQKAFSKLTEERRIKEKSIDEILGI